MGDLLLDHGGTRYAGIGYSGGHSRRRNFVVATFGSARDEFQSRVAGATNVVVGNTDLTAPAPIEPRTRKRAWPLRLIGLGERQSTQESSPLLDRL
jgi:hypothetical protein